MLYFLKIAAFKPQKRFVLYNCDKWPDKCFYDNQYLGYSRYL